jgi:hypothetical protein
MRKKYFTYPVMVFLLVIALVISLILKSNTKKDDVLSSIDRKIKVASCPTFIKAAYSLNPETYEVVATESTSQSIQLLEESKVGFVLSGRTLKPDEPSFDKLVLGNGYSFLANEEITLSEKDLANYPVFTDIDISEIEVLFGFNSVTEVSDVYAYLDKGIVITSWDNTDYTKAQIVHIFNNDGMRNKYSRRPTIYYSSKTPKTVLNSLSESIKFYVN